MELSGGVALDGFPKIPDGGARVAAADVNRGEGSVDDGIGRYGRDLVHHVLGFLQFALAQKEAGGADFHGDGVGLRIGKVATVDFLLECKFAFGLLAKNGFLSFRSECAAEFVNGETETENQRGGHGTDGKERGAVPARAFESDKGCWAGAR